MALSRDKQSSLRKYYISKLTVARNCSSLFLNPRPTGGPISSPPLSFSCDIFQTNAGITTKLAVPSLPTFLHHCVKILKSRVLQFGHKWRQSDVMFPPISTENKGLRESATRCSFRAKIDCLIRNDVELVGLQNCYLGFYFFLKFRKFSKILNIYFSFSKISPSKSKFSKNRTICWRAIADEYVHKISSRYIQKWLEIWHKTCQKQALFTSFSGLYRDFPNFIFWPILTLQKVF